MQAQTTDVNGQAVHQQVEDVKLYINGEFIDAVSGITFENLNPFTNQVINYVAEGRGEDMDKAVAAAKEAFEHGP